MQSAKVLSVASTKLTYSVPIEMPESLLWKRNFLRAKEIEQYFLWLLIFMDAAWCIREADDDLAFNEYFHIDPFTIIKIHFSKLLSIISSILNLRYAMRQQNLDMSL
jgi:hypothetical protein